MGESGKYNIAVVVKSAYLADQSDPSRNQYVFAYTVTITNAGTVAAQLVSRHWIITDAAHQVQDAFKRDKQWRNHSRLCNQEYCVEYALVRIHLFSTRYPHGNSKK